MGVKAQFNPFEISSSTISVNVCVLNDILNNLKNVLLLVVGYLHLH